MTYQYQMHDMLKNVGGGGGDCKDVRELDWTEGRGRRRPGSGGFGGGVFLWGGCASVSWPFLFFFFLGGGFFLFFFGRGVFFLAAGVGGHPPGGADRISKSRVWSEPLKGTQKGATVSGKGTQVERKRYPGNFSEGCRRMATAKMSVS